MLSLLILPACIATLISMFYLSRIALKQYDKLQPRTLSELAAAQEPVLNYFRRVLWICGTLFAITVYGYIVPRISQPVFVAGAWTLTYIGNLLAAIIPAKDRRLKLHNFCAQSMALGMLALAYLFWFNLSGFTVPLEMYISILMTVLGIMTILDKKRFIFYELPFIFLSHLSIIVAAVSL